VKQVTNASTDVTTYFVMRDSTNHAPKADVTVTDIDLYYQESGAAQAAKADVTALAAADSAHADNKAYHCGNSVYRIDWPDAAFDGGVGKEVILIVVCSGCDTIYQRVLLSPPVDVTTISADATAADNCELFFDGTGYAGGTTKLDVNTATISNGAITAAAIATGAIDADAIADNAIDAGAIAADAITAAKIADDAIAAEHIATGAIVAATFAAGAIDAAAIKDGAIDAATFAADVDAEIAAMVWNAATASYGTAGTYGESVEAILTDTGTTLDGKADQLVAAVITNAAGVDVAADIIALKAVADTIQADTDLLDDVSGGLADIHTDVGTAITAIGDVPTNAELATALGTADDAVLAAIAALNDFDPAADVVAHVTLVDTTTTNTDMVAAAPTVGDIADAVWDEALAGHAGAGSTGAALTAAGSAGDPWSTAIPGEYGAGTAGLLLGTTIPNAIDAIDNYVDTEVAALATELAKVPKSDSNVSWNATALAAIQAEATDALNAYDPPTNAEMEARTIAAADYLVAGDTLARVTLVDTCTTNTDMVAAAPSAADVADAVWDEASTGHTDAGKAGAQMWTDVDAILADTGTDGVVVASIGADAITAAAIKADAVTEIQAGLATSAEITALNDLDAAGIRTAVGLAGANLDTQLGDLPTNSELSTALAAADDAVLAAIPSAATLADAVWDEAQAGHTGAGSFGLYLDAKVSEAGGSGLTAAAIADAVLDEAMSGHTAAGSLAAAVTTIDDYLDTEIAAIKAKTDLITTGSITVTSPEASDGTTVTTYQGDDYDDDHDRQIDWTVATPDLTGATIVLHVGSLDITCTLADAGESTQHVYAELTAAQSATLTSRRYTYSVVATLSDSDVQTLITGTWKSETRAS